MRKIIIALFGTLLFTSCLKERLPFAATIYGTVTEAQAPFAPLQGVRVTIQGGGFGYTDEQGDFEIPIPALEIREYRLDFLLDGFQRDHTWTHKLSNRREVINFQLRRIN